MSHIRKLHLANCHAQIIVIPGLIGRGREFPWAERPDIVTYPFPCIGDGVFNHMKRIQKTQQLLIPMFEELISEYDGGVIAVGNDSGVVKKRILRAAKAQGLATVLIQDGWLQAKNILQPVVKNRNTIEGQVLYQIRRVLEHDYSPFRYYLKGHIGQETDYVAVYSEKAKTEFVKAGFRESSVVVTGSPRFTELKRRYQQYIQYQKRSNPNRNAFLLLTTHEQPGQRLRAMFEGIHWVLNLLQEDLQGGRNLYIKIHPLQQVNDFHSEYGHITGVKILHGQHEMQPIWGETGLAFAFASTMIVQAVLLGVPVIQLVPPPLTKDDSNYHKELPMVTSPTELSTAFRNIRNPAILMSPEIRSSIVKDAIPEHDSIEAVADLLLKLAGVT